MSAPALKVRTRGALCASWQSGNRHSLCHFYGHVPKKPGVVDRSCLSQFYPASFTDNDGQQYASAEQFMMASKARLFGDANALESILATPHPAEAKAAGRLVQGYDDEVWARARYAVVVKGNTLKFAQNPPLAAFLRATAPAVLVESAGNDSIWGIGIRMRGAGADDPLQWRGENLLGFALMDARDALTVPPALPAEGSPRLPSR
eukprot:TRINITY_DN56393_c0_g1_i1.p1 TRINITY_DN56393_c0_g1~~TRINITY_DN56393_c0_g1_i1.p1  ORF type:complete len:205 (-),score=9.24 TRINITY_DN56393_c0_g1_i1:127-741(-)